MSSIDLNILILELQSKALQNFSSNGFIIFTNLELIYIYYKNIDKFPVHKNIAKKNINEFLNQLNFL